ncbi:MAG: serine/threonine protein kinase [Proteobacteria bacterium]|nr:serine/threonine protein kinase [Pseudomonadota bacterium]
MSPETDARSGPASQAHVRGVLPNTTRLRSYEVIGVLGQGAFGVTYLARDATLNREVAIKEYLPSSLAIREGGTMVVPRSTELVEDFVWGRDRFLDEARTLAKLESVPGVVRVLDFLEANGTAYMVMALARGETLEKRLRQQGQIDASLAAKIMDPLMDGLEQVHEAGFMHRDIKPSNIIIDARGNPTLIDFGASRAAVAGRSSALTAIFTPGYAAPEQFGSSGQGPWTDIYGLSATLYHAITGGPPPNSVDRILEDAYRPLAELAPRGFPARVLAAIDAGLSVRSRQRPQNIPQWRTLLREGTLAADPPTVVMPHSRPAPRPSGAPVEQAPAESPDRASGAPYVESHRASSVPRRALPWAAVALALLLLAGGAYYAFNLVLPPKGQTVADETKRLQEDATRKAAADAEAKSRADAEQESARQQRLKAEEEAAKARAEAEARQKQEEDQRNQAALAARRAEEEAAAQRKAEAEAAALRQAAEATSRKAAE